MAEGGRELSQAAFGMALIPRGHKTPVPNTITLNVRISIYEFGGEEDTNIQSMAGGDV